MANVDRRILEICRKFKLDMQKSVDKKGSKINKITIQCGDTPPIIVAEKKKK